MEEEDKVGGGRYALAFFLAGPIGLGIQWLLRNRGWTATWVNAGVLVLILIVVFSTGGFETRQSTQGQPFVPPSNAEICAQLGENAESFTGLFGCDEQDSLGTSGFEEELDEVLTDYQLNYAMAIGLAGLQLSVDCSAIDPDPSATECGAFVEELESADESLVSVIERMNTLVGEIPATAPQEARDLLTGMVAVLEKDHRSNVLIIAGWNEQDSTKWLEGWTLSLEAAADMIELTEEAIQMQ